ARNLVRNLEDADRCLVLTQRRSQRRGVGSVPIQLEDREAILRDMILYGRAVVEPDMRQPRTRPSGRLVGAEQVLGTARYVADPGRADLGIAKPRSDHLVALALLDTGDGGGRAAGPLARRRIVGDVRPPHRAPFAPALVGIARGADVA